MHDAIYANRGRLGERDLLALALARALRLDAERMEAELRTGAHAPRVARDVQSARASGASAAPTFFVNASYTRMRATRVVSALESCSSGG
jgi:protein-disulfide isomerase